MIFSGGEGTILRDLGAKTLERPVFHVVVLISFLDEAKVEFYKKFFDLLEDGEGIHVSIVTEVAELFLGILKGRSLGFDVVPLSGPMGYVNAKDIKDRCASADVVYFDDLGYEVFFKYFVFALREGKTTILDQALKLSFLVPGFNCLSLGRHSPAGFLSVLREIRSMDPDRLKSIRGNAERLGERIFRALTQKPGGNEGRGDPGSQPAGDRDVFIFCDSYSEEKNQRYYRHFEYLRKKSPGISVFGIDYKSYVDWGRLIFGGESAERGGSWPHEKDGVIGIPFNNLAPGIWGSIFPFLEHFYTSFLLFIGIYRHSDNGFRRCYANSIWAGLAAVFLKRMKKIEYLIYEDLDYYPGFYKEGAVARYLVWAEKLVLRNADTISSVSMDLVELRRSQTPRPVIHSSNGVDLGLFSGAENVGDVKDTVIYTGTLDQWSGVDVLIKAVLLLRKDFPGIKLIILGKEWKDGFYSSVIAPLVERGDMRDSVVHLGNKKYSELPFHLRRATIGVIPNRPIDLRRYSCPLKLFEYAASGLPVVCTDIGEMGRLVKENGLGIATSFDERRFADALGTILGDGRLRTRLKGNCEDFARRYDWNAIFDEEERAIRDLLPLGTMERDEE